MAIQFFTVASLDDIYTVLHENCEGDGELFGSVVQSAANLLECYDHNSNKVLGINGSYTITAYAAGSGQSNSFSQGMPSNTYITKIYKTSKGIMLLTSATAPDGCIICKTNNGEIGCCLFGTGAAGVAMYGARYTVAWGDMVPLPNVTIPVGTNSTNTEYQTILQPIPTHPQSGTKSYLDGAYFLPQSQSRNEGKFVADGKTYVTNGFIALLDE